MDTLISVAQFMLALSLLVVLHEFGHYFFAKLFKTRVEKFYLFFDFLFPLSNVLPFSLFKKKIGETTYGIGWFPLGGYVKIAGMVDESMDKEQMKQPPQPWEFRSKKAWQRLLIMLGGIIVNVLLAFIIYAFVLQIWGIKRLPLAQMKQGVAIVDSFAYKIGFKDGDIIKAADGKEIVYFNDLMSSVVLANNVTVERNGKDTVLELPNNLIGQMTDAEAGILFSVPFPTIIDSILPGSNASKSELQFKDKIVGVNGITTDNYFDFRKKILSLKGQNVTLQVERNNQNIELPVQVSDSGTLGFKTFYPKDIRDYATMGFELDTFKYDFLSSFPAGIALTGERLALYIENFKKFINPSTGAYKSAGGFASMSKLYGPTWHWENFWTMTAFISIMLAFMNFLPIPGLDGGYVMFLLYEIITGRKPNEQFFEKATGIGLLFLLMVMLYFNGMDVYRYLIK